MKNKDSELGSAACRSMIMVLGSGPGTESEPSIAAAAAAAQAAPARRVTAPAAGHDHASGILTSCTKSWFLVHTCLYWYIMRMYL